MIAINLQALAAIGVLGWVAFWGFILFMGYKYQKNKTRITHKEPD